MGNSRQHVTRTTLEREICLDLLRRADYARVLISVRCLPAALPARIEVLDDQQVLLASTEEAVAVAAARGEVLSIQIDGLESDGATWSVIASGLANTVDAPDEMPDALAGALAHGATLVGMPLSVIAGERVS